MITLRDEIEIRASPAEIFSWLSHLDRNYQAWHPDHVACKFLDGSFLRKDARVYAEEYLHGKLHRLTMRTLHYRPNALLEYRIVGMGSRGRFAVKPGEQGTLFIAELHFGLGWPVVDRVLDPILQRLLASQLDAFRIHMQEEGQNLKALLEGKAVLDRT